jgi:ubiquinone/menaquinone biosynthesis C-methylase UbiE
MDEELDKIYIEKEKYIRNFDDNWHRTHITYTITKQYCELLGNKCANLGSNSGYICFLIGEFNDVNEVVGFDINQKALNFGNVDIRKRFSENIANKVKFKYSNLTNINCEDNYFDSIVTYHTLEHIFQKDLNRVVSEMCRILKQNGYVIISIPYEHAFNSEGYHVTFFNEKKLKELYELNGFETIECYKDIRFENIPKRWCLTAVFKKI